MRRIGLTASFGIAVAIAVAAPAHADDCFFSQVRWRPEGIEFLAGTATDSRTLRVDPASGRIVCIDPQVREPLRVGERIVFTDLFGVFELEPGQPPRHVLWVPSAGRMFVRATGADAQGRTLVWTYDRDRAEHVLWSAGGTGFDRSVQPSGSAALGAWKARNVAKPFSAAVTRFVRSTCLRRPRGDERLCVESIAGTERWRLTLGAPHDVSQLLPVCTPVAFAALPDSQVALIEVVEPATGDQAAALVTWLVRWSQGAQRVARVSPPPAPPHASWFQFDGKTSVAWADASGGLWRIPLDGAPVTTLMAAPPEKHHAEFFRVVVLVADRSTTADTVRARVANAGQPAGVRQRQGRYEVQAGAHAERNPAQARAATLKQRGFNAVRVEAGDATTIAPGLDFGHATGPSGRTAWVRHVERETGIYSELWIQMPGEAPRLLVPSLDGGVPGSP